MAGSAQSRRTKYAAAVFVKTPGYSPVKTRLAQHLGQVGAELFHVLSAQVVHSVLRKFEDILVFHWAVAEPEASQFPKWADSPRILQGGGDLGERLSRVYAQLLERYRGVFLLGADTPLITVDLLHQAVSILERTESFVLGPSEDGGFYLLGGRRTIPSPTWKSVVYSTSKTARDLESALRSHGSVERLPTLFDIDTFDDFVHLGHCLRQTSFPDNDPLNSLSRFVLKQVRNLPSWQISSL